MKNTGNSNRRVYGRTLTVLLSQQRPPRKTSIRCLVEARNLIKTSITAAFVFSAIAMEVALKETLLKPIVHGLVHAGSVASLVTDLVMGHRSMDRYKDLLLKSFANMVD